MPLDDVAVILVEPRFPGNVGAVARAMANTGFSRLVLVNPCPVDVPEARQMALGALPIIEGAAVVSSLEEGLAGCRFAVATTCRGGRLRREPLGPRRLAQRVMDLLPGNRVALVFGPEDRGLSNEELTLCQLVAAIPSHPGFASLNLAQAVMVVLWEIWSAAAVPDRAPAKEPVLADAARLEEMYRHLEKVLLEVGFLHEENPQRMVRALKSILNRAGLEDRDVRIIRGMLRQFDWYLRKRRKWGQA